MKFIFTTLSFTFLNLLLYAQKIEVALQPVAELKESSKFLSTKFEHLIKLPDGYMSYTVNMNKKGLGMSSKFSSLTYNIILIKYDASMNVIKNNDLLPSGIPFGPFEAVIEKINNKYYLVYYQHEEGNEAINIKASEIDINTLALSPPKQLLKFTQNEVGLFKAMQISERNTLLFEASPDKTKMLVYRQSGAYKDNKFAVSVFDKDLNVLWTKEKVMDVEEDIVFTSACVDNNGAVYTGYKISGKKLGGKGHVLITMQGNKEKDVQVSEDEMYRVLLLPSKNGNTIFVTGNCFGNTDFIAGVYIASLSVDKQTLNNFRRTDFEEKLIESFAQNGLAATKKNKYGLTPFDIKVFELEDGSVDIIGDLKFIKTTGIPTVMDSPHDLYRSGSILNARFAKDHVVFSRVPKNRESLEPTGESFFALPYKNSMIVLYNDNESNLKNSLTEMPASSDKYKNSVLVAATISETGDIKREIIIDVKEDNFLAIPVYARQLNPFTVLMPIRKLKGSGNIGNEFRWGTINVM